MSEDQKIYVANGKTKTWSNGGTSVKFALDLKKLGNAKEYYYELNGTKYINLEMSEKRISPDQYGKTHSVTVDTFVPDHTKANQSKTNNEGSQRPPGDVGKNDPFEDDIPW